MFQQWLAVGAQNGSYGYPTSRTIQTSATTFIQTFEGGTLTYTSPSPINTFTTAQDIANLKNAFDAKYTEIGGNTSYLGAPVTNTVTCNLARGGCWQLFSGNSYILYSPKTGVHSISPNMFQQWLTVGAQNGSYGYPTTDTVVSPNGQSTQTFEG